MPYFDVRLFAFEQVAEHFHFPAVGGALVIRAQNHFVQLGADVAVFQKSGVGIGTILHFVRADFFDLQQAEFFFVAACVVFTQLADLFQCGFFCLVSLK